MSTSKGLGPAFHPPQVRPRDRHNEKLVAKVHPPDWINPVPRSRYNMVVIGAGTAGLVTAIIAARVGGKVALIERHLLGGDCLNYGCVPSKALIRAARVAAAVREAGSFGVGLDGAAVVNFSAVMERMRRLRSEISRHDAAERFRKAGIDVFFGSARFKGSDSVAFGETTLHFARACIATGARAAAPPIPGLSQAGYLSNENLFSLTKLPRRFGVIGGGPIGCEMAQSFARFGAEVILFEADERILTHDDPALTERVYDALVADGVQFVMSAKVARVAQTARGKLIEYSKDGISYEAVVDEILVAAGRTPNLDLDLETAGVDYDPRAGITVDDRLRTTNPRVYAAGDVCSSFKFTHMAEAMAGVVIRNALFFGRARTSALTIPWSTYTDPELAHVGLTPSMAAERDLEITSFEQPFTEVDRAVLEGESHGLARIHLRRGSDEILGASVVASHAGEMISEITLAMTTGLGLRKIAATIHPYPTQSEVWKKLANQYMKTRLTPFATSVFRRLLRWRRR